MRTGEAGRVVAALSVVALLVACSAPRVPGMSSPDLDSRVAYSANSGGGPALFTVDTAGGEPTRLTPGGCQAGYPVVSPDGTRVAFTAKLYRDGRLDYDLYVVNTDGSGLRDLTDDPSRWDMLPTWSPDGGAIAYMSIDSVPSSRVACIAAIGADGSHRRELTDWGHWDMQPDWSPTGERIAFASDRAGGMEIYSVAAEGGVPVRLTRLGVRSEGPRWAPDGSRIAFVSGDGLLSNVYVMAADGSDPVDVTGDTDVANFDPAWAPDGRRLAFTANRGGVAAVYVLDLVHGSRHRLTAETVGWQMQPSWSADGREIAFAVASGAGSRVYAVGIEGGRPRRLTGGADDELAPRWLAH